MTLGPRILASAWLAIPAIAQVKLDPAIEDSRQAFKAFEATWAAEGAPPLKCRVQPLEPRMGFSFRYWAGFQTFIPIAEFPARQTRLAFMLRVRAKAKGGFGEPGYFLESGSLPEASRRPRWSEVPLSGGIYMGPGEYEIRWLANDDQRRVCRHQWAVKIRGKAKESALAPGEVDSVGLENWRGAKRAGSGSRVTVFLHAAPRWRGRNFVKLNGYDRMLMLNSLTSLLDLGGFASAQVVAYDMAGRRVLFQDAQFNPPGYQKLSQTLRDTGFGTVDYQVLAKGPSEAKFLATLIEQSLSAAEKPDTIVFLGPELRGVRRLPGEFEGLPERLPRVYYLALGRDVVAQGDMVSKLVKAAKGKTYLVLRGRDLLSPIRAVARGK